MTKNKSVKRKFNRNAREPFKMLTLPSREEIAKATGFTLEEVDYALKELTDYNLLEVYGDIACLFEPKYKKVPFV